MDTSPGDTWIALDRSFQTLAANHEYNDSIQVYPPGSGKHFSWLDVLAEPGIVILAEAGAGKTEEIRAQALKLRQDGTNAFFLRIEDIADRFGIAFEAGTPEEFAEWLSGTARGWVFLDSVDEARLNSAREFERAIATISNRLKAAFDRVHVVITSRQDAWRGKTVNRSGIAGGHFSKITAARR